MLLCSAEAVLGSAECSSKQIAALNSLESGKGAHPPGRHQL